MNKKEQISTLTKDKITNVLSGQGWWG